MTCYRCGHTAETGLQRSAHAYSVKYECTDRRACARRAPETTKETTTTEGN